MLNIEATDETTQLASWDGAKWSSVPMPEMGYAMYVPGALLADGTNLYAQLDRTNPDNPYGLPIESRFECWNGNSWSPLGGALLGPGGQGPQIADACIRGNDLYICGSFTRIGDVAVTNLAHWNGAEWAPVGSSFDSTDSYPYCVATSDRGLYVGGSFQKIGGVTVQNIARWNGRNWSSMAGGLDGYVSDLAVSGRKVCAVGGFSHAGRTPSKSFAIWSEVK